jgi:hypothetical protein
MKQSINCLPSLYLSSFYRFIYCCWIYDQAPGSHQNNNLDSKIKTHLVSYISEAKLNEYIVFGFGEQPVVTSNETEF